MCCSRYNTDLCLYSTRWNHKKCTCNHQVFPVEIVWPSSGHSNLWCHLVLNEFGDCLSLKQNSLIYSMLHILPNSEDMMLTGSHTVNGEMQWHTMYITSIRVECEMILTITIWRCVFCEVFKNFAITAQSYHTQTHHRCRWEGRVSCIWGKHEIEWSEHLEWTMGRWDCSV